MKKLTIVFVNLKNHRLLIVATCVFFSLALVMGGCSDDDDSKPAKKTAYSNMNDDSTTAVQATIPKIELSKLKTTRIKLYLSVTDQKGYAITGFNKYNFTVKQVCTGSTDTTLVSSITASNLNTTGENILTPLVMDYSGSMDGFSASMEQAVSSFIAVKGSNDMAEIIKFNYYPWLVQTFTTDSQILNNAVSDGTWPDGGTAFYDAVGMGITDANEYLNSSAQSYLGAVIGFTDGRDNESYNYNPSTLIDYSLQTQIPIYSLGFGDVDSTTLSYLATSTGGRYFYAPDINDLQSIYLMISGQLKGVYLLTWDYTGACNEVKIIVEVSYRCQNGTMKDKAVKSFEPLRK